MKNVLVVGASGGMGRATVKKLIREGYNVFGMDLPKSFDIDKLKYYQCDITDEKAVSLVHKSISRKIDNLFAIIFVSGIYKMDSLLEISDADIKKILDVNVLGVQRVVKHFFRMLKKDSRILITTSEVANLDPLPFNGIYSMSKSLLEKYAFSLRMEVNNFGIKVITLRPGPVKTVLLNESINELEEMCDKTRIHKDTSKKFKEIVNKVESKPIEAKKVANKISRIIKSKHPRYSYSINNTFALKIFSILPDRLQVFIISKLLQK